MSVSCSVFADFSASRRAPSKSAPTTAYSSQIVSTQTPQPPTDLKHFQLHLLFEAFPFKAQRGGGCFGPCRVGGNTFAASICGQAGGLRREFNRARENPNHSHEQAAVRLGPPANQMGQKFSTATGAHKINFCCASPLSLLVLAGVIICTSMTRNLAAQIIDDSIAGIGAQDFRAQNNVKRL